jgi:hypothetical protein
MWIYTAAPPYAFMAWCLISTAQGQLYLYHETWCLALREGRENISEQSAKEIILATQVHRDEAILLYVYVMPF